MIVGRSSPFPHLLLSVGLLLPAGSVLANRISVDGSVKMEDGSPVADAQVTAVNPNDKVYGKAKTKANGKFRMIFLPAPGTGPYRFRAVKDGLLLSSIKVSLFRDQRGDGLEFSDDIGAMQELPDFEISPNGQAEVQFVMVPDSKFAGTLTVPGNRKATDQLARANKLSGREMYDESNEILMQLVNDGIEVAGLYYLLGRNAAGLDRAEELVQWFEKGLELNPNQPGVHSQLAAAAMNRGDKELALEHYDKELEVSPGEHAVAVNRALLLQELGRAKEAVAALEKIVEDNPEESAILAQLASLYLGLGQEDKASEALERMRQSGDPDPALWFNIGANFSNRGEFEQALDAYEKALELNPEMAEAMREIGFLQIRTGDKAAAAEYLRKYLELQPDATDAARVRAIKDALVKAVEKESGP